MTTRIVLLGPGCYFTDSFLHFKELGHDVHVLRIPKNIFWNRRNYETHRDLGFNIIDVNEPSREDVKRALDIIEPDSNTLFIGGGFFAGDVFSFWAPVDDAGEFQLELLHQVSQITKTENTGSTCIRYFNGDTGWASELQRSKFAEKTRFLDAVLYDNELLQEFVLHNIPELKEKKQLICQLEKPLARFVHLNLNDTDKRIAILGRWISTVRHNLRKDQYVKFPVRRWVFGWKKLFMTGNRPYKTILRDRVRFQSQYGSLAFGLSHFYDVPSGSKEAFVSDKEFFFSLLGQRLTLAPANYAAPEPYIYPLYYGFTNTANKDINYLMYGIVPIIAHDINPFNKQLLDKGMCVKVDSIDELPGLLEMDDDKILSMKQNIANNMELFTFEPEAEKMLGILNGR